MKKISELIEEKIGTVQPYPDFESEDKNWYEDAEEVLSQEEWDRARKCSTSGMRIGYLMALKEIQREVQSKSASGDMQ